MSGYVSSDILRTNFQTTQVRRFRPQLGGGFSPIPRHFLEELATQFGRFSSLAEANLEGCLMASNGPTGMRGMFGDASLQHLLPGSVGLP
jgi:hypothetical protein